MNHSRGIGTKRTCQEPSLWIEPKDRDGVSPIEKNGMRPHPSKGRGSMEHRNRILNPHGAHGRANVHGMDPTSLPPPLIVRSKRSGNDSTRLAHSVQCP